MLLNDSLVDAGLQVALPFSWPQTERNQIGSGIERRRRGGDGAEGERKKIKDQAPGDATEGMGSTGQF